MNGFTGPILETMLQLFFTLVCKNRTRPRFRKKFELLQGRDTGESTGLVWNYFTSKVSLRCYKICFLGMRISTVTNGLTSLGYQPVSW